MSEVNSLKQKTAKGLLWGMVSNGTQQLLGLVIGIFLARLLTPADYGMVGMLTIFNLVANSIQESGFTAAIANKKEVSAKDYNAVFWFSVLISIALYILLFFCAPFIARFFNTPELVPLGRYMFLSFVISGFGTAHSAYLFRNMMVKQRAIATIIAMLISGGIGITMAFNGFAHWGIVTQNLTYIVTINGLFWYYSKWRPTLNLDFAPIKEMFAFSSKLLITGMFYHINNNLFAIVLGRFYTKIDVGNYNQANKWCYMGHSVVTGMINGVAQPTFAQVRNDSEREIRVFRKMLRFTAFITFPALLGLALVAPELITVMLTDKWAQSGAYLQLLCISGAFLPITALYSSFIISHGRSDIYMWNTICLGITQLAAMLLLYPYGIKTMIITYVCINIGWLFIWHYFLQRQISVSLIQVLKDILPFAGITCIVMLTTYYLTSFITSMLLVLLSRIVIAAILYIFIMWVSRSVTFKECVAYLLKKQNL